MEEDQDEEKLLRSSALQNANSILLARRRAELALSQAKEALEEKTQELSRSLVNIQILHGQLETRVSERTAELVKANEALNLEIVDRKRSEEKLRNSENRYRSLVSATAQIVWTTDAEGRFSGAMPEWQEYTGQSVDQIQGEGWHQALHPDEGPQVLKNWTEAVQARTPYSAEYRLRRRDGAYRDFAVRATPVLTHNGDTREWVGCCTDITDRKRVEEALRQSDHRLRKVIDSMYAFVALLSIDGVLLEINQSPLAAAAMEREQVIGQQFSETYWWSYSTAVQERLGEALRMAAQGASIRYEEIVRVANDQRITVDVSFAPLRDGKEKVVQIVLSAIDITEGKRVEIEKQNAIRAAEHANRAKSEFLSNMSHELRTPLNGIIGLTDLLLSTPLNVEQKEFIEAVHGSGGQLLTMVNDILDFSKMEYGKLQLYPARFRLSDLVEKVIETLNSEAVKKNLKLVSELDHSLASNHIGDAARISQVLINLVGNAIKFTAEGEVRLKIGAARPNPGDEPATRRLLFSVEDSGLGIPADQLNRLFKVFSQVDASTTRQYGGSGLGLAICKKLVELMGGKISVRSSPKLGSTFSFDLPLHLVPSDGRGALPSPNLPVRPPPPKVEPGLPTSVNILLVEDNLTNQMVARAILTRLGYEADVSSNGLEAIRAVKNKVYDLIFMDVHMPEMDGLEATRMIRQMESGGPRKKIVALTADVLKEELDRCLEVGMDEYATKPIKQDALKAIIENLHAELTFSR